MALAFIATWVVVPVAADVYECRGMDGKTVLTNRPKGLRGCVRLDTMTTPSSPGTSASPPVPHDVEPGQVDPLPVPLPLPMPPLPPHGVGADPSASTGSDTPPPNAQAGNESNCQPQINPLNPLSGRGCPPADADPAKPETSSGN